ncbi:MAG: silent information regulator protein Sir2, partial [Oscillospiraceae bacterium]|nr:silent information regulator protein Sir2 [Oscillospiraceae bacterium]
TASDPAGVLDAIQNVPAGGVIYLLEGTYKFDSTILIDQNNSGTKDAYKTITAYNNAKVVFDFSAMTVDGANRGIVLDGSYWYFYGFEITKAGDNGMLLSGNNNIIEMMQFTSNQDTGLQISRYRTNAATIADWPTNNLIKNCTAKNNCDDATMENADGFAAKLTCGEGNVFDGCMSYNNSDDGWDLYAKTETGPIGVVTIKNCIAFRNGFTEDGRGYGDCDGNGFKLGGGGVGTAHVVENCLAFENLNCGFTDNNNPLLGSLKDCTAYNNGIGGNGKPNFSVYRCTDTTTKFDNLMAYINTDKVSKTDAAGIKLSSDKFVGEMTNSLYYNSKKYYFISSTTKVASGDKTGDVVTPADGDFMNLTVPAMGADFHTEWRNADGSPKPAGFAETASNGTYATLGYHMASGLTQTATPGIGEAGNQDPVEPPAPTTPSEEIPPTPSEEVPPTPSESESTPTGNTKKGDANEDGIVDISDVVRMNRVYVGVDKVTAQGLINADIDGSGKIELADSMNVLRYLVHLLDDLDSLS